MDLNDPASYRPISNLSFLSEVVEKGSMADSQNISVHRLLPVRQSAYPPFHSTETAVVSIHNDMIGVVDQGHIGPLVLLDMSAALDTLDHSIFMDVLRRLFGINGSALSWVAEFLSNRRQVVYAGKTESDNIALQFGVPQGSVLGLRVLVQYAEDVDEIFRRHGVHHHLFADDMQGYCSGRLDDVPAIVSQLENCIVDIYAWYGAKRLQFNADKTERLWFGPASQQQLR